MPEKSAQEHALQIVAALAEHPELLQAVHDVLDARRTSTPHPESWTPFPVLDPHAGSTFDDKLRKLEEEERLRRLQQQGPPTTRSDLTPTDIDDLLDEIPDNVKPKPNPDGYQAVRPHFDWK